MYPVPLRVQKEHEEWEIMVSWIKGVFYSNLDIEQNKNVFL